MTSGEYVDIEDFETPAQLADHLYYWPMGDTPVDHAYDSLVKSGYLDEQPTWTVFAALLLYFLSSGFVMCLMLFEEWFGVFGSFAAACLSMYWFRRERIPRGNAFAVEAMAIVRQAYRGTYTFEGGELSLSVEAEGGELTQCAKGGLEEVR